ncbi:FMN-binding protein [Bacillus tuaregi]|uniref:FMN-binding protein n=1 Tax=Bacillus tuaregi TaxID=1816695 RepID=UPI0013562936|nr:FMN-binding protein [Bacillus tuaregi]
MKKRSGVLKYLLYIFVLLLIAGCGQAIESNAGETGIFHPGTYKEKTEGYKGPIKVSVTVDENTIKEVNIIEHRETEAITDDALEQIPHAIVERQSISVDTVAGATYTSRAIIGAVKEALLAAGASLDDITKSVDNEY